MKKSFTLIEVLIVIIILGILATITTKILIKVYENYYYSKAYNSLAYKTDLALNIIASKLTNRIKNSLIAVECNVSDNGCYDGNVVSFDVLPNVSDKNASLRDKYKVLEWLGIDVYSKRGMWDGNLKMVVPGYSGFVDLKKTDVGSGDEYNITTPDSNFTIVKAIDSNWTAQYGISGDIFSSKHEVLVFSGSDDRGDFLDVNHSYGYYENLDPNNSATRVFEIKSYNVFSEANGVSDTKLNIKAVDESNSTTVFEKYYLVNSAYAIVPVANKDSSGNIIDYNLTLFYNYYPWNDEIYTDGNESLLVSNVTQFKFKDENGVVRILLCIDNPKIKVNGEPITVCKEKVVF
ncbi:prepilin-type N-terminal cleavage/methylation domain-containing protein [Caminibacter sp.]